MHPDASLAPAISVVVPSYNMAATIEACLTSVIRQGIPDPYEIVVVDSSTDRTPALVREGFPVVRLERRDHRVGPAAARNIGAQLARAPMLIFLDADCTAPPGWLARALSALRSGKGFVGGAVQPASPYRAVGLAVHCLEFAEFLPCDDVRIVEFVPSCNLAIDADVLRRAGMFPEHFDRPGAEDMALCARHREAGGAVVFDGTNPVLHVQRSDLVGAGVHLFRQGRASAHARRRHRALEGQLVLRWPLLTPALVPLRWLRVLSRLLEGAERRKLALAWVALAPLGALLLCAWALGFYVGARDPLDEGGASG